jgi:hypothetical protein
MPRLPKQPLAEVFGFRIDDQTDVAKRHRRDRLCPFHNRVANCTKDKVKDPLGVCTIYEGDSPTIVCPVRFLQDWTIVSDAAEFLFPKGTRWTHLGEVRLNDKNVKSAGNIDHVLVAYDEGARIVDFGSLEVQGVYISGNLPNPFDYFMADPEHRPSFDWSQQPFYPSAD